MGALRGAWPQHARGGVRARGPTRGRGDHDPRALPVSGAAGAEPRVVLFAAAGCHLCDDARAVLDRLAAELGFAYEQVDITGVDALETRYRELLPVVEVDGRRAFAYFVPPDAFRCVYADAQARRSDPPL